MQKINCKIKLAIMYGGPGEEHEVSIMSAKNILKNIKNFRSDKYEVWGIFLGKETKVISTQILEKLSKEKYVVWPIFHGFWGEGGYVQKTLEKNKIKFIGSGAKASSLAIDKFKTQKVLEENKILCPKSLLLNKDVISGDAKRRPQLKIILKKINFPVILKPVNSGSSVDLYKVKNPQELEKSLKLILSKYGQILLQEFVEGREFTCGVLNIGKKIKVLPLSEVCLNGQDIFDYKAKYATQGIEITPAKVDKKIEKKIMRIGKSVHEVIGCLGVTRTDMILDKNGRVFVLEINTIPGMTKVSFIPEQLRVQGISIPEFVDIMVKDIKS